MDNYALNYLIKDKNNVKINAEADIFVSLFKIIIYLRLTSREFTLTNFRIYAINSNKTINMMLNLLFGISKKKKIVKHN